THGAACTTPLRANRPRAPPLARTWKSTGNSAPDESRSVPRMVSTNAIDMIPPRRPITGDPVSDHRSPGSKPSSNDPRHPRVGFAPQELERTAVLARAGERRVVSRPHRERHVRELAVEAAGERVVGVGVAEA